MLTFQASATDLDVPTNTLYFSLSGAPVGASINEATGMFSWSPTTEQCSAAYAFEVRVTDNGAPMLTDVETIRVVVPPTLGGDVHAVLWAHLQDAVLDIENTSARTHLNNIVTQLETLDQNLSFDDYNSTLDFFFYEQGRLLDDDQLITQAEATPIQLRRNFVSLGIQILSLPVEVNAWEDVPGSLQQERKCESRNGSNCPTTDNNRDCVLVQKMKSNVPVGSPKCENRGRPVPN